ncbi:MAG: site-2 protease family protein [Candidatus Hodarchaeota archaeon]
MDPITFLIIIGFAWISLNAISHIRWFEVKNPQIGLGYALIRTKRLNQLIDMISKRGRVIWKFIWDIGIISGLGILIVGLAIFTINIPMFFLPSSEETTAIAVTPVIPGITVSFQSLPYFLVAIMIGAIVHEFSHGIAARVENVDLKSTGIFIFLVFFGAFVEPDDSVLFSKSRRSIMRIFAAGALANMITAGIVILILIVPIGFPLIISPLYHSEPSGALVIETIADNPASQKGMKAGYAIIGINQTPNDYQPISSAGDFHNYSDSSILPYQTLTFHFAGDIEPITLQTVPRPDNSSKGFIGIRTWEYFEPRFMAPTIFLNLLPYWVLNSLLYIFMINIMLAIFNLLPIPFLDGDKLLTAFLGPKYEKYSPSVRYLTLGVLGINLLLSLYFMGWQQI